MVWKQKSYLSERTVPSLSNVKTGQKTLFLRASVNSSKNLDKETEEAIEEFSTTVANGTMKQLKDNLHDGHYLKETIDTNDNYANSDEQSKFKEFSKVQRKKDGQVAIVHSVYTDSVTMTISRNNKKYTVKQSEYDLYDMYKVKFTEEPLTDSFEEELEEMCNPTIRKCRLRMDARRIE